MGPNPLLYNLPVLAVSTVSQESCAVARKPRDATCYLCYLSDPYSTWNFGMILKRVSASLLLDSEDLSLIIT